MITVSQDEYIRMLNLLKYQANFILKNSNVDKISETKEEAVDFLVMLNDLQLTFDDYLAAKDKYILDDSYLEELNKTKKQLNDFVYGNWDVDRLIVDKSRGHDSGC
jgi:hypothetical protein